jgi:GTP-binding protein LepA
VDSWYDAYLGVIVLVRVVDGVLKKGTTVRMMGTGATYEVDRVGVFRPKMQEAGASAPARSASSPAPSRRWPTPASATPSRRTRRPTAQALPGFKPGAAVVFCGLFPWTPPSSRTLRAAMGRLRLNDASFSYEMETSRRSASASAAASSGCCTWRSSRSAWSASSTWT